MAYVSSKIINYINDLNIDSAKQNTVLNLIQTLIM